MIRFLILAAALAIAAPAVAAPPEGADPSLGPWFQGLKRPDTNTSCCDVTDCRPVESRTEGDRYQALVDGKWIDIPNEKVIHPSSNPVGRAVLCASPAMIYCFAPGLET